MKLFFTYPALAVLAIALLAPVVYAHGDEDHGDDKPKAVAARSATPSTDGCAAQRQPDGSLWVSKAAQHRLGLRTQAAQVQNHALAVELNGRVLPDPNAGGRVQATQGGRIEAGPKGLPVLGQSVVKGQVLAYLRPASTSLERGNQQSALVELEAQYALAERKLARYEQLVGAVPQKDIEAARLERDALQQRRAAIAASVSAPEALTAPVNGTLVASNVVLGQVVEARDVLFEVVDPKHLMVEALAYDAALTQGLGRASAAIPGGDSGVWLHPAPERFVPRVVRSQPLDASTVVVRSGLDAHDRVVTQGASLLAQVR